MTNRLVALLTAFLSLLPALVNLFLGRINAHDKFGRPVLHIPQTPAAAAAAPAATGASANARDTLGDTPLLTAGSYPLLDSGADPALRRMEGDTQILVALGSQNSGVTETLIRNSDLRAQPSRDDGAPAEDDESMTSHHFGLLVRLPLFLPLECGSLRRRAIFAGSAIALAGLNAVTARAAGPGKPISCISHLPAAVGRRMPRGAKSCFFGSCRLSPRGPQLFLHLYNLHPKHVDDEGFITNHFRLEFFDNQRHGLRLIKSVRLNYRANLSLPKCFSAQLLWLDPKQHRMPILKFDCFITDGFEGLIGDYILVVLPHGLAGKPVVQSLAYGAWKASNYCGQSTTFDERDREGLLQLHVTLHPAGDYIPVPEYILNWNGRRFRPTKVTHPDPSDEPGIPPYP